MKDIIKLLCTWLGKPETATEDELKTAFAAKTTEVGQLVTAKKVLADIGFDEGTTVESAKTIIMAAKKSVTDQVAAFMAQLGFEAGTTVEEAKAVVVMAKANHLQAGGAVQQMLEMSKSNVRAEVIAFMDGPDGIIAGGKLFPVNRQDVLDKINADVEPALIAGNVVQAKKSLDGWKAMYAKMPVVAPINHIESGNPNPGKIVTPIAEEIAKNLQIDPKKMVSA